MQALKHSNELIALVLFCIVPQHCFALEDEQIVVDIAKIVEQDGIVQEWKLPIDKATKFGIPWRTIDLAQITDSARVIAASSENIVLEDDDPLRDRPKTLPEEWNVDSLEIRQLDAGRTSKKTNIFCEWKMKPTGHLVILVRMTHSSNHLRATLMMLEDGSVVPIISRKLSKNEKDYLRGHTD